MQTKAPTLPALQMAVYTTEQRDKRPNTNTNPPSTPEGSIYYRAGRQKTPQKHQPCQHSRRQYILQSRETKDPTRTPTLPALQKAVYTTEQGDKRPSRSTNRASTADGSIYYRAGRQKTQQKHQPCQHCRWQYILQSRETKDPAEAPTVPALQMAVYTTEQGDKRPSRSTNRASTAGR